jgi:hypothetical protein
LNISLRQPPSPVHWRRQYWGRISNFYAENFCLHGETRSGPCGYVYMDHYLRKLKNFYILASVGRAIRTQLQPIVLEPLPKRIAALARKLGIIAPRTPEATKKDDT